MSKTLPQSQTGGQEQDTNWNAKIRVGNCYQAEIPPFHLESDTQDHLMWTPAHPLSELEVEEFVRKAINDFEYFEEQALSLLLINNFDLVEAEKDLLEYQCPRPLDWTLQSRLIFEFGYLEYGKNMNVFFKKCRDVLLPDKSMGELVAYYYQRKPFLSTPIGKKRRE